jgi:hypothetical protein
MFINHIVLSALIPLLVKCENSLKIDKPIHDITVDYKENGQNQLKNRSKSLADNKTNSRPFSKYEEALQKELLDFKNYIFDVVCKENKLCKDSKEIKNAISRCKSEAAKKDLLGTLNDVDFVKTGWKIIETIESDFSKKDHGYKELIIMSDEIKNLIRLADEEPDKIDEITKSLVLIFDQIEIFEGGRKEENESSEN